MFLPYDDIAQLPAGTHGLYSDANCTQRVGVLDVSSVGAGFEKWHWQSGHSFDHYQGNNEIWFYLKIASNPPHPWTGTVHEYPDEDLPSETNNVAQLDGDYLEITLQAPNPQIVGYARWTEESSPSGHDELEWFIHTAHRNGTTKRVNLSPGDVIQFRQPSAPTNSLTVHVLKSARKPGSL